MKKGNGMLTYRQMAIELEKLKKENAKLRNELNSRTIAYNKLLAERKE